MSSVGYAALTLTTLKSEPERGDPLDTKGKRLNDGIRPRPSSSAEIIGHTRRSD